jgi:D-alanyl-D-alanine endopeptidase (penicillin-binding protein 7)
MPTYQKKIVFLLLMIVVAFGTNIVPRNGRIITAEDKLNIKVEKFVLASLESQAAVTPSSDSDALDDEIIVGSENDKNNISEVGLAIKEGAFTAPPTSFEPPFKQRADIILPEIGATIALIADLESGTVYLKKGINRHWPIASITKLMTAVIASRALSPDALVTISSTDISESGEIDASSLSVGEQYRVQDLIQIMLIASNNIAAEALARTDGREAFLKKLNEQARLWGMNQTYFYDPSGLSPVNQSSAADLEKLAFQLISRRSDILEITRQPGVRVTEQSSGRERRILPINIFAGRGDFLGGKTGFTNKAGGNLFSVFSVKKRPVLIVVFNSSGRFEDTATLLGWFKENYE